MGRPYTHIFSSFVKYSGAVGLALSGGSRPVAETAFPALRAINAPLKVPGSERNLINELDNANPTALLISAIEKARSLAPRPEMMSFTEACCTMGVSFVQLHHILAGGPSRGTMTPDSETVSGEGTCIQVRRTRRFRSTISSHLAFPPSNDNQSRYGASPTEEHPRIRRFATGAACRRREG